MWRNIWIILFEAECVSIDNLNLLFSFAPSISFTTAPYICGSHTYGFPRGRCRFEFFNKVPLQIVLKDGHFILSSFAHMLPPFFINDEDLPS